MTTHESVQRLFDGGSIYRTAGYPSALVYQLATSRATRQKLTKEFKRK
jgi:hypothetical protein